jgi:HAE1 family hydrophobic/amphiphilic exporter-1
VQGINPLATGGMRLSDLQFYVRGPDLARLQAYAEQIMDGMRKDPGFVDVDTTLNVRTPELRLLIDREKAADLGINVRDIAATVQTYVAGQPVSKYKEADEQYDIWLRAEPGKRRTPQDIYDLTIRSPSDQLVRLGNLVRVREELGPAQIDRVNRQRSVTIEANLLPGMPLATAVERVRHLAGGLDMPALYDIEFTGRAKSLSESNAGFLLAFVLSIIFMYMVLAAQFESFLHPVTIMLALPLTIPFALVSLVLLGEALNVYSVLGLFMLFGVVKKNGILQIDYTNTLRERGMPRDQAILEANRVRLRPILMTTLALVGGMLPMALGTGPGAEERRTIAVVVIGGQTLSLFLTLVVVPVVFYLVEAAQERWSTARTPAEAAQSA